MFLPVPAAAPGQASLVPPAALACSAKELLLRLQPCSSGYLKAPCCLPGGQLLPVLPMAHAKAVQLPLPARSPHAPHQHPCPGLGACQGQRVQPHRLLPVHLRPSGSAAWRTGAGESAGLQSLGWVRADGSFPMQDPQHAHALDAESAMGCGAGEANTAASIQS